ncbi:MAG TPA: VOC family protein [Acidimicrobiales bacterium]|nr:VOC family protein [Acidimicrobiales bacterium]
MAEVTTHVPNTPGWIDIGTDVPAAKAFYCGLFGWSAADAGPPEETGGYGFFTTADGKHVAGYGPQQNPGPPFWSTYVIVPSAADVVDKVTAAGGQVVVPPMEVPAAGTFAVFTDAGGAFISVWQPGQHTGAQVVREPGAFTWCELRSRDAAASKAFYASAFGWGAETMGADAGMPYTEFKVDGESVAGMMEMTAEFPSEVPAHWLVYVEVADTAASLAEAVSLGGSVQVPVVDFPGGQFAVIVDPQGAAFGIMTPSPQA